MQQAKKLLQDISETEVDLAALERAIQVAESEPWRFKVDTAELGQRREFVSKVRRRLSGIKLEIQKWTKEGSVGATQTAKEQAQSERNQLLNSVARSARLTNGLDEKQELESFAKQRNDQMIKREIEQQKLIMDQQDEALDHVGNTVHNLKNIAITIGDEVEDQNALLEETEARVDNTNGRLAIAQNKVKDVLKAAKADTKNSIMILCLTIVLIILLVFIVVS